MEISDIYNSPSLVSISPLEVLALSYKMSDQSVCFSTVWNAGISLKFGPSTTVAGTHFGVIYREVSLLHTTPYTNAILPTPELQRKKNVF